MDEGSWSGPAPFKVMYAESARDGVKSQVAVLINNNNEEVGFRLPAGEPARTWRVAWSIDNVAVGDDGRSFAAPARSISLLVAD